MPADIFNQRFIAREYRKSPWHKLGTIFPADRKIGVLEAMKEANMLFKVSLEPVVVNAHGKTIETGMFAVVREPTADDDQPRMFGVCTSKWEPVQNEDLAGILEGVAKYYPLDTAGVLGNGDTTFVTFKSEPWAVKIGRKKDELEEFHYFFNYNKPGHSNQIGSGHERVVCRNTLLRAIASASFMLNINHHKGALDIMTLAAEVIQGLGSSRKATRDALQMMAKRKRTDEQAKEAFAQVWLAPARPRLLVSLDTLSRPADPNVPSDGELIKAGIEQSEDFKKKVAYREHKWEYGVKRAAELQETAMISLTRMVDEGLGVNDYTIYNAAVEVEQHRASSAKDTSLDLISGDRARNLNRLTRYLSELATN